jgi:hypothetical protein
LIVFWRESLCFVLDIDCFIGDFIGDASQQLNWGEKKQRGGKNATEVEAQRWASVSHKSDSELLLHVICTKLIFLLKHEERESRFVLQSQKRVQLRGGSIFSFAGSTPKEPTITETRR